jgi:hypothetical protein
MQDKVIGVYRLYVKEICDHDLYGQKLLEFIMFIINYYNI